MTIYYQARFYPNAVSEVEVIRETDYFVTLKSGRREAKQNSCHAFHKTREAAKAHILERLEENRRTIESKLKWLELEIEKAKLL